MEHEKQGVVHQPKRVEKGWGYELWIANSFDYCGKILAVKQGKKCSMHFHVLKTETFYILDGTIVMRLIHKDGTKEEFAMGPGDTIHIEPGLMHQFEGVGSMAKIMEVSTQHFDDDSYRVDKGD